MYLRNKQGIIVGAQSIHPSQAKHSVAVIFFHGFSDTPQVFKKNIHHLQSKIPADFYAFLLPYHGHQLSKFALLNNEVVINYVQRKIQNLASKYPKVYVVAHSYSGTVVSQLLVENKLAANIYPILYAPAIYIFMNTPINVFKNHVYQIWRKYCNYEFLGCSRNFKTSDDAGYRAQMNEISLQYKVVPAINKLFTLDSNSRDNLFQIIRPFAIIIAKNDSRVSYSKIAKACYQNSKYCQIHILNSGKHMPHYGNSQKEFEKTIVNIIHASNL